MKRIKKFEELNEELGGSLLDISPNYPKDTRNILDKLEKGSAILVNKEDLEEFYKAVSYYIWIDYEPKLDPEVCPDEMYWVLIGNKLYHTDKPSFGGQNFEVYKPEF